MREPNRFNDNLIQGYGDLDSSRPLDWSDPESPRVHGRPGNIRQIVSWWGRLKAAWLVFSLNAVAVRWYDERNAHRYGRTWYEWARERNRNTRPIFTLVGGSGVGEIIPPCGSGIPNQHREEAKAG